MSHKRPLSYCNTFLAGSSLAFAVEAVNGHVLAWNCLMFIVNLTAALMLCHQDTASPDAGARKDA